MKKLLALLLVLGFAGVALAADEWDRTDPAGTESPSDLDTLIQANNNATDRLLANYRHQATMSYTSVSSITVSAGEVSCPNSAGTVRHFRRNPTTTTVSWADIDAGSEAPSTTYYVYAVADADATTFTVKISASSSAPSGATYFRKLGTFYNDASSNITNIVNDNDEGTGGVYDTGWFAVSANTQYAKSHNLGTTKCLVLLYFSTNSDGTGTCASTGTHWHSTTNDYGLVLEVLTSTSLTIGMAAQGIHYLDSSNTEQTSTSGYARVVCIALE